MFLTSMMQQPFNNNSKTQWVGVRWISAVESNDFAAFAMTENLYLFQYLCNIRQNSQL